MLQQHVFGRDGGVGLQLEHPVPVRLLAARAGRRGRAPPRRSSCAGSGASGVSVGTAGKPRAGSGAGETALRRRRMPDLIAPSIVAGKPVAVQSPASDEIARPERGRSRGPGRRRSCARGGGEGGAAFLHHPHRRHRARRAAARRARPARRGRRFPRPRRSTRRLAALMVTETMPGLTKTHSAVPPISADEAGARRASASVRKCMLTIAWNASGATSPGSSAVGHPGRDGQHHRLAGADRQPSPPAVSQRGRRGRPRCRSAATRQPVSSRAAARARARPAPDRRRSRDRPSRGKQRHAGPPAAHQRLAHHASQQPGQRLLGRRVQRGHRQRLQQPPVQRPGAGRAPRPPWRRRGAWRSAQQRQIVAQAACPAPGARGGNTHQGSRPGFGRIVQRSPLSRSRNGKARLAGPAEGSARADRVEIVHGGAVARQQQVVAVVDAAAQPAVEIGAAAPAGGGAGLVERRRARRAAPAPPPPTSRPARRRRCATRRQRQAVPQRDPQFLPFRHLYAVPPAGSSRAAQAGRGWRRTSPPSAGPASWRGGRSAPWPRGRREKCAVRHRGQPRRRRGQAGMARAPRRGRPARRPRRATRAAGRAARAPHPRRCRAGCWSVAAPGRDGGPPRRPPGWRRRRRAPTAARPPRPRGRNRGRARPAPAPRCRLAASISMPSMTASKSACRRPKAAHGAQQHAGHRVVGLAAIEPGDAAAPVHPGAARRWSRTAPGSSAMSSTMRQKA